MTLGMTTEASFDRIAIRRELARRELAKKRLIAFVEYGAPWYQATKAHRMIARKLEEVAAYIRTKGRTGIGRLLIEMPPRHGKTALVSQFFPAWLLGQMPDSRVILASYGGDLAHDNSKKIRDILTSDRYKNVFGEHSFEDEPVMLSADSRAAKAWELAAPHRGGVVAVGVGGGVTGRGGHLLIPDDLYKNREEAESETVRKSTWSWWSSSFYTRLEDWGAIVGMTTRWHEDDVHGRLMKNMAEDPQADRWDVLSIPALAFEETEYAKGDEDFEDALKRGRWRNRVDPLKRQPGAAIWPGKFDEEQLAKIKVNIGPYDWASLYQQQPRPLSGGFLGRDWDIVDKSPEDIAIKVRFWDLALKEGRHNDYTAAPLTGYDWENVLYVEDMIRAKLEWPRLHELIVATSQRDPANVIYAIEDVAFQYAAFLDLANDPRMRGRGLIPVRPEGSKFIRAIPLQTANANGKVRLVRGPWNGDFIEEAASFKPDGTSKHDDQIDSVTGGMQTFRLLAEMDYEGDVQTYDERVEISAY